MATKQQVREQITNVIQTGILTQVLPFTSSDAVPITITAQNYQTIVTDGQTGVGAAAEGEQTIIYEQDFQTAENEFNRFVDDITDCYKNVDGDYEDPPYATFGTTTGDGISYSFSSDAQVALSDAIITQNITAVGSFGCTGIDLQLEDALVAITQFQSLSNTLTQIDPTQAQEILDTTIFELMPQQSTKQQKINQFFTDYSNLTATPPDLITDENDDGVPDVNLEQYDLEEDISNTNTIGSIVRLDENAGTVNKNQTLEWLRDDLNNYFFDGDDIDDETLPTHQERSSGYLKFREMNQAIIIRNTENQQVIPDSWGTTGFTITMWVRFKDKVSGGTLFNYGNPLRTNNPFGFMLETLVENDERYLRLVVRDGDTTIDSHIGIVDVDKVDGEWNSGQPDGNVNQLVNVPTDFNEWYFIVATFDTSFEQSVSDNGNKNLPLYWTGNLQDDLTTTTHHSGLGNRCKVEIISKTDLLRARGFKQE